MLILEIAAGVALAPVVALALVAVFGLVVRFWKPLAIVSVAAIWIAATVIMHPEILSGTPG